MTRKLQAQRPEDELLARERAFFDALLRADVAALGEILAEDFTLIDVSGGQMTKDQFLGVIAAGQLKFTSITAQGASRVRVYGTTAAAVNGRTTMSMWFMNTELSVESRYTHVYAPDNGTWRMEIAQGTPIQ